MVAPYTLILTPNGSKKAWPPRITAQNDGYINTKNSLKYKKRRIRRRRIVPTRKRRRDKKRRIRKDE